MTDGDLSKGHRTQPEWGSTRQFWDNSWTEIKMEMTTTHANVTVRYLVNDTVLSALKFSGAGATPALQESALRQSVFRYVGQKCYDDNRKR